MTTNDSHKRPAKKKLYAKPEMRRVILRAEEAVLGACKTGTSVGPGSTGCQTPSPCVQIKS